MKLTTCTGKQGFTLIELMVVLLILGLLIGIVGPKVIGQGDQARVDSARIQIKSIESALKMYRLDNAAYPSTEQGLDALINMPQTGDIPKKWRKGGYMDSIPKDPWGYDYVYMHPGVHGDFDLFSRGADGATGGDDFNADITNWEQEEKQG
ncbi:MAG: type II secretion system major pseudopilin GspG [Desulfatitalea sp.]|nr:type II secretion system major pseudopilin GspG [Desulfatitalea sp.]NNJ99295.1 type II secretion system major pseudopilin GspG [Desulfatitalea sp.]